MGQLVSIYTADFGILGACPHEANMATATFSIALTCRDHLGKTKGFTESVSTSSYPNTAMGKLRPEKGRGLPKGSPGLFQGSPLVIVKTFCPIHLLKEVWMLQDLPEL